MTFENSLIQNLVIFVNHRHYIILNYFVIVYFKFLRVGRIIEDGIQYRLKFGSFSFVRLNLSFYYTIQKQGKCTTSDDQNIIRL